jgi:hypothetical protein
MTLFDYVPPPGMARSGDHDTSVDAAVKVAKVRSDLQRCVLLAFELWGPMTARQAERLPQFAHLAPSTVRKRISELYKAGELVEEGTRRDGMKVWKVRA